MMAYITADRPALMSVLSDPGKFYNADPFTFLMASLLVLIFGAGFFSLDNLIRANTSAHKRPVSQRASVKTAAA